MNDRLDSQHPEWERRFRELLPLFGHRNWIVVADAAYPAQANAGIETMIANADHMDVLATVVTAIEEAIHIRANVYVDQEFDFVTEEDGPGITEHRNDLDKALHGAQANRLPHEQIIARLDQSADKFRVLLIKTDMTIPYTSIFFELDCGYWNADAELRLRQAIRDAEKK